MPRVTYARVAEVCEQIENYHAEDGPGQGENFVGSLRMYIPLHNPEELQFLRHNWGSWGQMAKVFRKAQLNEGAHSLAMQDPNAEEVIIQTFCIPLGFLHQPLDEVRDYCKSARNPLVAGDR